mgnify:CR=1 FL=1
MLNKPMKTYEVDASALIDLDLNLKGLSSDKIKVSKKVAEAFRILMDRYSMETLFERGYQLIKNAPLYKNVRTSTHIEAASVMAEFFRGMDEPATMYARMLIDGFEVEYTQEEVNAELLEDLKCRIARMIERKKDFAENGPLHIRNHYEATGRYPQGVYELGEVLECLENIKL